MCDLYKASASSDWRGDGFTIPDTRRPWKTDVCLPLFPTPPADVNCPAGSGGNAATQTCAPCAAGTYGSGLNNTTPCMACQGDTVSAGNAAACTACAGNEVANGGKTACVPKPPAPCAPGSGGVAGVCAPCLPGTFGTGLNDVTPCAACANGTVAAAAGATTCTACTAGLISNPNNTLCISGAAPFTPGDPICKSQQIVTGDGFFELTQPPATTYGNNEDCTIQLLGSVPCELYCDVAVDIKGSTQLEDVISIWTVPAYNKPKPTTAMLDPRNLLARFSGAALSAQVPVRGSDSGIVLVHFESDALDVGPGWNATWKVTKKDQGAYPPHCADRTIKAPKGSVSDGSGAFTYGHHEACSTIIDACAGACNVHVKAAGKTEDLWDYLELYKVTDRADPAASMTAANLVFAADGVISEDTIVAAPAGMLLARFTSSTGTDTAVLQGWTIDWEAV
ncbi:MAG: hypothetical protein J3K34DRAFT_516443 [Monoraphidium minutum]|nr:MAG: hypothetical protein J3K34DRAFT_516443 [Monoraphidium minutum]